jgi:uncharacterized protein (DUF427 family)
MNPRVKRDPISPGQESVWDYPRPPRVEHTGEHVTIELDGAVIAESDDVVRVLETSHPPVYYLPRSAFTSGILTPAPGQSYCEFKGIAGYLSVGSAHRSAWFYPTPTRGFETLADRVAIYPGAMDRCTINGETVLAQEGDYYGGWITAKIVGPFKGAPGTMGW